MPWSAGSFTRVGGVTHWVDDKNAAILIVASRHDTNDEDLASGINDCLTKDNQSKPTANFLPNLDNNLDLGSAAVRWRNLYAVTGLFGAGSAGSPSISFASDTNTGISSGGADVLVFSTNGAERMRIQSSGSVQVGSNSGTAYGLFAFNNSANSAFYVRQDGAGSIAEFTASGGTLQAKVVSGAFQILDGVAGTPAFGFFNDTDTGFYRDTSNQIGIALGGSSIGQIANGSYTGTLTGGTTSPTTTVTYRMMGNVVVLSVGAQSFTSNATSFTITGAPALIRPTATPGIAPIYRMTDNGADQIGNCGFDMNSSGTLTFYRAGSSLGWTNSGSKGIPSDMTIVYPIR